MLRNLKSIARASQDRTGDHVEPSSQSWQRATSNDGNNIETSSNSRSQRLSDFTRQTRRKTKQLLNIDEADSYEDTDTDDTGISADIDHDPAFHTSALGKKKSFRPGKSANKTLSHIKSLGKAAVHPVDSIKSKATRTTAGQLSKAERPYLSQKEDLEYLEAHDNLARAKSSSPSRRATSDEDQDSIVGSHQKKIREIEAHRESLRAAWTTSRHVRRVRVVPKRHIDVPHRDCFVERDGHGQYVRFKWLEWIGLVCYAISLFRYHMLMGLSYRISSTILKTFAHKLLMTSMNCRSILLARDPTLNVL